MSHKNEGFTLTKIAASAVPQYVAVTAVVGTGAGDNAYCVAASCNVDVLGLSIATVPTYGYEGAVVVGGITKGWVIASAGAGARMMVGSTNGGLIPITASGLATALGSALGAQGLRFAVGILQEARAAGEYGSIHLDPRQIVG